MKKKPSSTHAIKKKSKSFSYNTLILFTASLLILISLFIGVMMVQKLYHHHESQSLAKLNAIISLKKDYLELWLQEHLEHARRMHTTQEIKQIVKLWKDSGSPELLEDIAKQLKMHAQHMDFDSISMVDRTGQFVLNNTVHKQPQKILQRLISESFANNEVLFSNLLHGHTESEKHFHIDYIVPLFNKEGLALVMRLNKDKFLFPFLQKWPLPSRTAETLLFEIQDNSIVFLNQLRHYDNTALKLHVSLAEKEVIAVQIAHNKKQLASPLFGIDYRGNSVLGVAQTIEGTPWYLIAKIDKDEAFEELYRNLIWVVLSLILAVLTIISVSLLFVQKRKLQQASIVQQKLAESSLQTVFQSWPDLFFRMSSDGVILDYHANDASNLYQSPEKFIGQKMQDILPAEVNQLFLSAIEKVIKENKLATIEYSLNTSGSKHEYEARLNHLPESNQLIAIVRDITAKKNVERALHDNEKKFRALFEQAGGYCMILDPNTADGIPVIVDANKAACAMHGYTYEEFIGRPVADIDNEAGKSLIKKRTAEIMTGKAFNVENEHIRKDGSSFFVAVNAKRIDIGNNPPLILSTEYDISDRKKAEIELKQSESRFRAVFEQAAVGVARLAPDGSWLQANKKLCDIVGYTHEELLAKTFQDITHPDDLQIDLEYVSQLLENKIKTYSMEKRYFKKNGDIVWINLTASIVRDSNNKPDYFIAIIENITETKCNDEKLKRQHLITKTITDNAASCLFMTDEKGYPTFMNPAAEKVTGYTLDKIKDKPLHDSIHYKYPDGSPYLFSECPIDNGKAQLSIIKNYRDVYTRADGSLYPVKCYLAPLFADEKIIGSVLEFQDITESKLAEDKIRKISLAVEQSPESIIITNTKAEIEYINESFLQASGYSREEIIGQNPRVLQSSKTPVETYKKMWSTLTAGKTWKGIFQNRNKDGNEYTEQAIITPLRQTDGTISHYVAVKEDITEKNRLAKELELHRHHLQSLVELRTKELLVAQKQAETANQAKSIFLANMSHEIRTPMNAILGLTHLLQKDEKNSYQLSQLTKISTAGTHLLSLINDILDLSKIEAGKLELEKKNFNLEILFDNIQSLLNEQFREKGVALEVTKFDFSPWLMGDATHLRQALLNYLSNALEFTKKGKVTLRVKKLKEQDNKLLLHFEVEDTGIGIEPENLTKLFRNFEQVDQSNTRQFGGTGLGLSITKHLANLMGGAAGAQSEPNQGSTFWFSGWFSYGKEDLSLSSSSTTITELKIALRSDYAGGRILLVEDNDINLEVAQGLLCDVSQIVDTASNGKEAVEKATKMNYDLIIMDIQMPEMDGLEATRHIRATEGQRHFPILAMTAGVLNNEKQACITAGMDDFVCKPIILHDFYSSLIKWLPKHLVPLATASDLVRKVVNPIESEFAPSLTEQLAMINGLDISIGLRNLRGDTVAYLRLLRLFDSRLYEAIAKFKHYFSEGDMEQARQLAHSIKGTAGTLGLTTLQNANKLLEGNLKSQSHILPDKETDRLLEVLSREFNIFHQALQKIEEKRVSEPVTETSLTDAKNAKAAIKRLEELLEVSDAEVNSVFLEAEQLLQQVYGSKVQEIGYKIERFDFPKALILLKSL